MDIGLYLLEVLKVVVWPLVAAFGCWIILQRHDRS